MHLMYFTEQPMSAYPEAEGREFGATALMFSNRHFDPAAGSRLYNEYLEHYRLAENVGFDGIMLNEHHNAPFCMQAKCNVFASILAATTRRVKIVLLGNPLPLADNPVRLAEELAMIDMVSRGRLVSGFVRGGGQEQLATGVNPAFNRERFEEAHELIVRAWTQPGPFRWEGAHYQHRVVNPWAVPLQKPHPRVWIPGVLSKETIIWAAKKRYPYIALSTAIDATKKIWELYDSVAQETGYAGGPEYRGYLQRCHVAETEEKALANARQFMWMQGEFTGLAHPVWSTPSGYFSPSIRTQFVEYAVGRRSNPRGSSFEDQINSPDDRRGHAQDRDPEAPAAARRDAAVHPRLLGGRWIRLERGYADVHPAHGRGSAARLERNRKRARPLEPLRGQRTCEYGLPRIGGARQRAHRRPSSNTAGGVLMRVRSWLGVLLVVLLAFSVVTPALAAPEPGTMVWGVHVTLVSRWLDPGETEGVITPFMVLYALHDALGEADARQHQHAEPRRVVDGLQRRHHLRLRAAQERQVPQRRPRDRRGREVHVRAIQGRVGPIAQGQGEGGPGRRPEPRTLRAERGVAGLHRVLRHVGHRRLLDRAQEVRREGGREGYKKAPVGAGPFKFVSFQPGIELVLDAFPDYWRKAPQVKRIIMRASPTRARAPRR
jgi:alkanesulfonate monooxygenase SsuD/methylene tetrahydromethanopterin reductase-like flavin-dependent oxidoreductase (luciferase family)